MDNWYYLVGAYTIAWLGIVLYMAGTLKRIKIAEEKLRDVENKLSEDT